MEEGTIEMTGRAPTWDEIVESDEPLCGDEIYIAEVCRHATCLGGIEPTRYGRFVLLTYEGQYYSQWLMRDHEDSPPRPMDAETAARVQADPHYETQVQYNARWDRWEAEWAAERAARNKGVEAVSAV